MQSGVKVLRVNIKFIPIHENLTRVRCFFLFFEKSVNTVWKKILF